MRSRVRVAVSLGTLVVSAAVHGGCATSEPPDLTPEIDPTLPAVDASFVPARADGGTSEKIPYPDGGADDDAAAAEVDAPKGGQPFAPTSTKPAPGEVLITEIMYDPAGAEPDGEWFELFNVTSTPRSLDGLVIADGGQRVHAIAAGTTIAGGAHAVLVRKRAAAIAAKVPPAAILYEYGENLPASKGVQLANGDSGGLSLRDGGTVVAQADYGGWFSTSGASIQLKVLGPAAGASKGSWCVATQPWSSGSDRGTPGAAHDCP